MKFCMKYELDDRSLISRKVNDGISFSPPFPGWLWGPPGLSSVYWGLFTRGRDKVTRA
jgi:hypothetical protein